MSTGQLHGPGWAWDSPTTSSPLAEVALGTAHSLLLRSTESPPALSGKLGTCPLLSFAPWARDPQLGT